MFSCFRVDATAKADGHYSSSTPIEFAVVNQCNEALVILQEFVEVPDDVKFDQLKRLMNYPDDCREKGKKEFAEIMRTMPVDLVRRNKRKQILIDIHSGEQ